MSQFDTHDAMFAHFSPDELAVLERRARTLAQFSQASTSVALHSLLTVRVGSEHYALHLDHLVAIHDRTDITPVPCTPHFIQGIANIRGRLITVLNLGALLNGLPSQPAEASKLLLLETHQEQVALLIDQTEAVTSQALDQVQPLPPDLDHIRYAQGLLPDGVVLLDVRALVHDPALLVDTETTT